MKAPVHGILLLDKPAGMTSNAALQRVRRLFGGAKAGHTGSLDPLATGLLPICFGEATRISGLLLDAVKAYRAEAAFGRRTDTGDVTGQVVAEAPLPVVNEQTAETLRAAFLGEQKQVPPMYSALKQGGQRLYRLARQGRQVERKPRTIHIHELDFSRLDEQGMCFDVRCSKGTYVRVLIEDMGRFLATEACMTALRRTGVGPFEIGKAVTLASLEQLSEADRLACLLPSEQALLQHPVLQLDAEQAGRLLQGQRFRVHGPRGRTLRAHGPGRRFLGLVYLDDSGLLRVERLFPHSAGLL